MLRNFTSKNLARNLTLYESTWPYQEHLRSATIIFLPFLGSKPKHHEKYMELYADFYRARQRPCNVLLKKSEILDFVWITKGVYAARKNLNMFEHGLWPDDRILIHGMSVGCFVHAIYLQEDGHNEDYRRRIIGQLHDSPVYGGSLRFGKDRIIAGLTEGIANPHIKNVCKSLGKARLSFGLFEMQMDSYINQFIDKTPAVPTLTFTSTQDQMIDVALYEDVVMKWKSRGMDVEYKCFDDTPHVRALAQHPDVYRKLFNEYLTKVETILDYYDGTPEEPDVAEDTNEG